MRAAALATTLGVCAVLLAALTWGVVHPAQQGSFQVVGKTSPNFAIRTFDGHVFDLAELRGIPIVLNFWASWCVPCREEAAALNDAARNFDRRIQFLGADIRDSDQAGRQYQAAMEVPYPVGPVVRGSYLDFGVTKPPETLFIDRQGIVIAKFIGPITEHLLTVYMSQLKP